MIQEADHIKNTVALIFRHSHCLHLMNSEAAWVLVYSGAQVQPQIIQIQTTFQTIFPFLVTMIDTVFYLLIVSI